MIRKIFISIMLCLPLAMLAQTKQMVIYRDGRMPLYINVEDVDSITFIDAIAEPHEYVDLGLSILWATTNIGAEKSEDYGFYFAWGETATKDSYTVDNYKYASDSGNEELPKDISATKYDAATILWKGEWRMPTIDEIEELTTKCSWTWTSLSGINGYRVTGATGNSIFLPASGQWRDEAINVGSTGYYWSATLSDEYQTAAYNLNFTGFTGRWNANRAYGFTIRPVCNK